MTSSAFCIRSSRLKVLEQALGYEYKDTRTCTTYCKLVSNNVHKHTHSNKHTLTRAHTHTLAMNYRVLVVGEGKHFGLSTACLYVTVAGEYGVTEVLEMPRGEYQTETTVRHYTVIH